MDKGKESVGNLKRIIKARLAAQKGGLLVETVVVLSVFGILGTTVLSGLQTGSMSKRNFEQDSTEENITRNQLDSVFEQPYKAPDDPDPTYTSITPPTGYTVTAESITHYSTSSDISIVRITVIRDGQTVRVHESLRTNW